MFRFLRFFTMNLILFSPERRAKDTVTQFMEDVTVYEGMRGTLDCGYDTTATPYLSWYKQYPNESTKYLLRWRSVPNPKPRMSPKVDKENKRVDLELSSTEVTDSAVYYCALRPTVTGNSLTEYSGNFLAYLSHTVGYLAGSRQKIWDREPKRSTG
uniref:Ig-like domain-containing protein n=1 Tax=Paramormyrops kingsleyae TaxID=1676925 RepID=A0A3B3Q6V9_9TELE